MSHRIAFWILAVASFVTAPAAQAGQHSAARPGIHVVPQRISPSPRAASGHSVAPRRLSIVRHGRRFSPFIEGIGGGFGSAAVAIAEAPANSFANEAASYPYLRPDPDWQICQIGPYTDRYYECGPYSYHPFGAYGYRPNGTYGGGGRVAPEYVLAPNAKIIIIEHDK